MLPMRLLLSLPFYFCKPRRRLPCLLPCPMVEPVPDAALKPCSPGNTHCVVWDPVTLRILASETNITMLRLHLNSIAKAVELEAGCNPMESARAVQNLVTTRTVGDVTDVYILVLLSLQRQVCQNAAGKEAREGGQGRKGGGGGRRWRASVGPMYGGPLLCPTQVNVDAGTGVLRLTSTRAALSSCACSVISICQNPDRLSNFVLYFVLAAFSIAPSRFGMLPVFLFTRSFNLMSVHRRS